MFFFSNNKYHPLYLMIYMNAREVLNLLRITRPTLSRYIKEGRITATRLPDGRLDHDQESVYTFFNKDIDRTTVIHARVSTPKQKKDLENQVELVKQFCLANGWRIGGIYSDIASGISFEKREEVSRLLKAIIEHRIERVVTTCKDRMSRVGFDLFNFLFSEFNTSIVVISEIGNPKLDSEEIFEEIVSLLHCYSMNLYSKRKRTTVEELIIPTENGDE
jgi:putative resolvase